MVLHHPTNNQITYTVTPEDDSEIISNLMGEDILSLVIKLSEYTVYPIGTYTVFGGTRYTLYRPPEITKHHTRYYEYVLNMYAPNYGIRLVIFRQCNIDYTNNVIGGDLKVSFPLTATPKEHLQMLCDNLNRDNIAGGLLETNWTVGECIGWNGTTGVDSGIEKLVSYDKLSCIDALALIADTFETEYYFDYENRKVSLGMLEINKDTPLPMSYGKGNGFISGVGRTPEGDLPPVGKLIVEGGTRNIDPSRYGIYPNATSDDKVRVVPSHNLLLPLRGDLWYDGDGGFEYTDPLTIGYLHYVVSEDRAAVINAVNCTPVTPIGNTNPHPWKENAHLVEDCIEITDIYPKLELTISYVKVIDAEKNLVDIYVNANSGDAFFNQLSHLTIGGQKPTVIFNSGQLAGRELDLQTDDNDGTIDTSYVSSIEVTGWRLRLVPEQIDGVYLPGGNPEDNETSSHTYELNPAYMPAAGDKFAIYGIRMPDYYLDAYSGQTRLHQGAEWDLFRRAVEYLYKYENEAYNFNGEVDPIWARSKWTGNPVIDGTTIQGGVGGRMKIGNYIRLDDNIVQNILMRITSVQYPVNNPYMVTLSLSNMPIKSSLRVTLNRQAGENIVTRESAIVTNTDLNGLQHRTGVHLATIVAKTNQIVDRVNDDRTLFTALSTAIATYNSNQDKQTNKIDFSNCLINGSAQGYAPQNPSQCKSIPELTPISLTT